MELGEVVPGGDVIVIRCKVKPIHVPKNGVDGVCEGGRYGGGVVNGHRQDQARSLRG